MEQEIEDLQEQIEMLEFELQDTVNSFNTLIEILVSITSSDDIKEMFKVVLSILSEHFEFKKSIFTVCQEDYFEVITSHGFPDDTTFKQSPKSSEALSWCVKDINSFMVIKDISQDAFFDHNEFFEQSGPASVVAISLDQPEIHGVFIFYLDLVPLNNLRALANNIDSLLTVLAPSLDNFVQRLKASEERKVIQSQLIQTAKLASLGQMSAGIAHELNNPLFAIMTFAQNIQKKPQGDKTPLYLEKIIHSTERMAKIVDHLKRFSRKSEEMDFNPVKLHAAINEAYTIFSHQLTQESVQVEMELANDQSMMTLGDVVQLESVFQNLFSNSKDAFNERQIKERKISIKSWISDDQIKVLYQDNAGGMPKEVVDRIFDPFFTTKGAGKGTGLGMNISYEILKQHKATIEINSTPGEGTIFELSFNLAKEVD